MVKFECGLAVLVKTCRLAGKNLRRMQVSSHQKTGQIWVNLAKFAAEFKSIKFSREVYARVKFVRH